MLLRVAEASVGLQPLVAPLQQILRAEIGDLAQAAGLRVEQVHENEYEFLTEHALQACDKYGVVSVSLLARN